MAEYIRARRRMARMYQAHDFFQRMQLEEGGLPYKPEIPEQLRTS